jgi:hypothetical protein
MLTVDALRARCIVDPVTRCWHWQGAKDKSDGTPRLYTFDHARQEKRTINGPAGAFNIVFGRAPLPGWVVYRCCGSLDCLAPTHLREMRTLADVGRHIAASGRRKGPATPGQLATAAKGRAAQGREDTPAEIVRRVRSAPATMTGRQLAKELGVSAGVVSRIRCGHTYREIHP